MTADSEGGSAGRIGKLGDVAEGKEKKAHCWNVYRMLSMGWWDREVV
jgi:hypothetical protein